jgi:hypothetical protein
MSLDSTGELPAGWTAGAGASAGALPLPGPGWADARPATATMNVTCSQREDPIH